FKGPSKEELKSIKETTFIPVEDLIQGYQRIRKKIDGMGDKDKVITLNEVKLDLNKIIGGLEVDVNVLKDFESNYKLIKKNYPEIVLLIMREYRLLIAEKRIKGEHIEIT